MWKIFQKTILVEQSQLKFRYNQSFDNSNIPFQDIVQYTERLLLYSSTRAIQKESISLFRKLCNYCFDFITDIVLSAVERLITKYLKRLQQYEQDTSDLLEILNDLVDLAASGVSCSNNLEPLLTLGIKT